MILTSYQCLVLCAYSTTVIHLRFLHGTVVNNSENSMAGISIPGTGMLIEIGVNEVGARIVIDARIVTERTGIRRGTERTKTEIRRETRRRAAGRIR